MYIYAHICFLLTPPPIRECMYLPVRKCARGHALAANAQKYQALRAHYLHKLWGMALETP